MPYARPALLWDRLDRQRVRCRVCRRRCAIEPGGRGFCLTRENRKGTLVALTYGQVAALHLAPIEAKPLFHFYPGSRWLSLGSLGCNFRCPGCQNWEIAHARVDGSGREVRPLQPAEVVAMATERGAMGLSWTYNEPTLWLEYTLDAGKLARERGLLANYVTNGYITPEALATIAPLLDAYRVDLKAFDADAYRGLANVADFQGVLDSAARAKHEHGLHVECVTNVVPGYNDEDRQLALLAAWIADELGPETPWHVTRFVPHRHLGEVPPTPAATLERARQTGRDAGLLYVYVGNVPGHPAEHSYCHCCGALLVRRRGQTAVENRVLAGRCPFCGVRIPGQWGSPGP
ncbi:MAG: AmmeMemoRadiSam system radical SAM enzyme [Candidatus Brocadiia bacterium]